MIRASGSNATRNAYESRHAIVPTGCLQMVNSAVARQFLFDDESYAALAEAEVGWGEANGALRSAHPQVVRPVGADGLAIVARAPGNGWLVMGFVEQANEVWLLTDVRRLSTEESAAMDRMLGGRS
jgi:hypothetical protein